MQAIKGEDEIRSPLANSHCMHGAKVCANCQSMSHYYQAMLVNYSINAYYVHVGYTEVAQVLRTHHSECFSFIEALNQILQS
jgi:hypothetical protein